MNIWLSIVHNILKRFWESREISVQEAHGWKSALDHCHIWALVQHYIKTRMILSFWVSARAREHFQKCCCRLWTRTKAGLQWKAVLWSDDWRSWARVVQNQLVVSCYTRIFSFIGFWPCLLCSEVFLESLSRLSITDDKFTNFMLTRPCHTLLNSCPHSVFAAWGNPFSSQKLHPSDTDS